MKNHPIQNEIAWADEAINSQNFDRLLESYEPNATLVVRPGRIVSGQTDMKNAFEKISEYFNHSLKVSQEDLVVIEAGDTALVMSKAYIESPNKTDSKYSKEREAIYVYRKDKEGKWRCLIDNSYGFELLSQPT